MGEQERKQYMLNIGNRIKQLRLERNLSQGELATMCGYTSCSTINKIEMGINDAPYSKIYVLAQALNVPVSWILCWDEVREQYDIDNVSLNPDLIDVDTLIVRRYGESARDAVIMYSQLDAGDKGEIRGEMKQMLKSEKYSPKEGSGAKAI